MIYNRFCVLRTRLDDGSMEIRNLQSRGPCAVAFRPQQGRYILYKENINISVQVVILTVFCPIQRSIRDEKVSFIINFFLIMIYIFISACTPALPI